jgi:hypothetical protein
VKAPRAVRPVEHSGANGVKPANGFTSNGTLASNGHHLRCQNGHAAHPLVNGNAAAACNFES